MTHSPEFTTCTAEHSLSDGRLHLLGAVSEVVPTATLLEIGGASLLIDCGAPSDPFDDWQVPDGVFDADAVLLTHAHMDHVGGLLELLKSGFYGPVFATRATLDIARILLGDRIRHSGGSADDVYAFAALFDRLAQPVRYGQTVRPVNGFDVAATLREAGHILGSASVEVISGASRVIVSGDLGRPDSPILRDYNTAWDKDRPVDLVLMEATYGNMAHEAKPRDIQGQLERAIKKALVDGGHILVPAFAIGRTQVLLYHLNALVESRRLADLAVAVDTPLGLKITDTYARFKPIFDRESLDRIADGDDPLDFENLFTVRRHDDSVRLRDVKQPILIIAGSGMCTGGRIVGHLKELLPRPETCVIFVGHQAAGTPGRTIQDAFEQREHGHEATVRLFGEEIALRADVEVLHGISAHAGRNELKAWLGAIPAVGRVALHHGTEAAQNAFASWVAEPSG